MRCAALRFAALAGLLAVLGSAPVLAQEGEPDLAALRRAVKSKTVSLGILMQVVGDYQDERGAGTNGFRVANARVSLGGDLDGGFGYFVQANLAGSVTMLDAVVRYRAGPGATIVAGQFKAPYSYETLTGAGDLDFINRARIVTALSPARQLGVQVRGRPGDGRVDYGVGVFNGNGFSPAGNDDDAFLVVGRLAATLGGGDGGSQGRLVVGGNLARSRDRAVSLGAVGFPTFAGDRTLFGGDVRWDRGRWLLGAEVLAARLEPSAGGGPEVTPYGWHATVGYDLSRTTELLLRWDGWRDAGADEDVLVAGLTLRPTGATRLRVNYLIPLEDAAIERHQALVGLQLAF